MIVYGEQKRQVDPAAALDSLASARLASPTEIRDVLIELGEIEAAVADELCPEVDAPHPQLSGLREAGLALARLFRTPDGRWKQRFQAALGQLRAAELPQRAVISVPEGYAYYGLAPETYGDAAARFFRDARPRSATIIGIRSIGTSLSAFVGAALEEPGCAVRSYTVRPYGHPFQRVLRLSPELIAAWRDRRADYFVIVDEGPGLSGSSFAAVARAVSELGVPDERIVLFPSWYCDGSALRSDTARERWDRHAKYTEAPQPFPGCRDLSAGRWRSLFYDSESAWPAVQPQHERRKYLRERCLLKFAGFGRYGRAKLERARRLWEAGFTPRPIGLEDGYLVSEFVPGAPVPRLTQDLLDTMANYIALLHRCFPSSRRVPYDQLMEMISVNVREGLGAACAGKTAPLERFRPAVLEGSTTEIDGRMLPYEWLATGGGYVKVDTLDHHSDHFFPACQDIAWDVAAACVEFSLSADAQQVLMRHLDGTSIRERLPFYLIAYLSYRMGYCTIAAEALGASEDANRFRSLVGVYANRLSSELGKL